MEWIKINKEILPEDEVLAANFLAETYGYKEKLIGYLQKDLEDIVCENEHEILSGCTHYIDIDKFDIEA